MSISSGSLAAPLSASIRTEASYKWLSSQKSMFPSTHSFAAVMPCLSCIPRVTRVGVPPVGRAAYAVHKLDSVTATIRTASPMVRGDGLLVLVVLSVVCFWESMYVSLPF